MAQDSLTLVLGAVEGRAQAISSRHGLHFTLYDLLWDRAVSCYLVDGHEAIMRNVWGRRAVVEGWITRDPLSGHPQTIRQVTRVTPLPDLPTDDYRRARGACPPHEGAPLPEVIIRHLRDA
jgi:hypothetical protein